MTLRNSTSADNNRKFLFGTYKSTWTQCVLNFLVMFFVGPVPLLMMANSYQARIDFDGTIYRDKNIEGLVSAISESYAFICVFASILAVISAILAFNYLNSKVSVNFYHSLPFKRSRMFFTNYTAGIFSFLAGFILNYIISILIPLFTDMGFEKCLPVLTSVFLNAVLFFLFIYSLTVMLGMTTGLPVIEALLTLLAFVILPALRIFTTALRSFDAVNFWGDYFLEYEKFVCTTPFVILFENKAFDTKAVIVMLVIIALSIALSLILYYRRLSEKSGNPFVFGRFASFIKYLVMLPVSMGFALLFGYIGDESFFWLLFGSISGAVVAAMIMNSIILKTARAMFTNLKGIVIFTVAVTLFNSALVLASEPIDNLLLKNEWLIKSVSIELDGSGREGRYTFKEKENKEALLDIINEDYTGIDEYYTDRVINRKDYTLTIDNKEYYIGEKGVDRLRVRFVAKTVFGYDIAQYYTITDRMLEDGNFESYFDELKIIADSKEYRKLLSEKIDSIDESYRIYLSVEPNMIKDGTICITRSYDDYSIFNNYSNRHFTEEHRALLDAYKKDIENIGFDDYNVPVIGNIRLTDDNYYSSFSLPITLNFTNTLEYLVKCGIMNSTDYAGDLAEALRVIYVYDYETDKYMTVQDIDEKRQILESVDTYDIYNQYSSVFNTVEHRYKVFFPYKYEEEDKTTYYYDDVYYEEMYYEQAEKTTVSVSDGRALCEFINGKVPAFVTEYFE